MNGVMPITSLLMRHFDKLKRDENGTVIYDERFKEITKNLLNHESLDSALYHTYDEFFNAVSNEIIKSNKDDLDGANFEEHSVQTCNSYSEQFDIQFQRIKEVMNNPSKYSLHSDREFFRLSKGCKSKYRYVSDVLTMKIWQSWRAGEQIFISAGTGRGKNTFIKNELLKHCRNQKVVIFENRQSLMQQQIKDYFVFTTNVDHQFQKAGFDKNRIFYTQGDYGLF